MRESVVQMKPLQFFLTEGEFPGPSIFEVFQTEDKKIICTCPTFKGRSSCKHVKFVKLRMDTDGGIYRLEYVGNPTYEEKEKSRRSFQDRKEFIIKYGKIEIA